MLPSGFHSPEEIRSKAASDVHTDLNSVAQQKSRISYADHMHISIYQTLIQGGYTKSWVVWVVQSVELGLTSYNANGKTSLECRLRQRSLRTPF